MKSAFRSEGFKRKFNLITFVYNLVTECLIITEKLIRKMLLNKGIKKPGLRFNLRLALIGPRTNGPSSIESEDREKNPWSKDEN